MLFLVYCRLTAEHDDGYSSVETSMDDIDEQLELQEYIATEFCLDEQDSEYDIHVGFVREDMEEISW